MSQSISKQWYLENSTPLYYRARRAGVGHNDALDLVQEVALAVHRNQELDELEKAQRYGNAVMSNRLSTWVRLRRRDCEQLLPLDIIEGLDRSHADLDTILASSQPVSMAAATIDRATPAQRDVLVAGLFHRCRRKPMEKLLRDSPDVLRAKLSRVGAWLEAAPPDPFGDDQHLATKVRPLIEWAAERHIRTLRDLAVDDKKGVEEAFATCRAAVLEAAAEIGALPQSVQLADSVLRFVSPFKEDPSAGGIHFRLARPSSPKAKPIPDRFEDPAIQDTLDLFRASQYSLEAGDESAATRDLAWAWRRACDFRWRDDVERLAISWLRRHALVRVVWRVLSGVAREADLAPLLR